MKWLILMALPLALAGCGNGFSFKPREAAAPPQSAAPAPGATAPVRRPPAAARTAAQFDATSAEERAAASAPAQASGERSLGTTVASLGDPSRVGFWLETPLVDAPAKGRVVFPGSGKSANVDLIPIDGPATAGSRISLSAMRLIEAPLTDLPTVQVFEGS